MRIMKSVLAATLLAAAPVSVGAAEPVPAAIAPILPSIDASFAQFQRDTHSPGLAYGIVADGRLIHVKGLGVQDVEARRPVTAESLFRIASMTKAFTALAILKLRDEGKLSLDDLAERHVPEMRDWRYPTSDSPRIRISDLLTHSAGFVTDNPWGDRQQPMPEAEFTAMLDEGVPFSRAPGTAFEYSNFGYALLGRIVANVSGMPYKDYIEQALLRPLGMNSTSFEVMKTPIERRAVGYRWQEGAWVEEPTMAHGAFSPMGGMVTSASDYARYVAWLLSAWPPRDGPENGPVKRSSIRELIEGDNFVRGGFREREGEEKPCPVPSAYGKGMSAASDCELGLVLSHSGGYPGYGSYVLLLPERGVGIFAFSNLTYNAPVPQVWKTALALDEAGAIPARKHPVSPMLAEGYRAAGAIYRAGDVMAVENRLAMNFLMDRSAETWRKDLADLKAKTGDCVTDAPIAPTGNMSGTFTWRCERGGIEGEVLLAPNPTPAIQELSYSVAEP